MVWVLGQGQLRVLGSNLLKTYCEYPVFFLEVHFLIFFFELFVKEKRLNKML